MVAVQSGMDFELAGLLLPPATDAANRIESNRPRAKKNQQEGCGSQREWKLIIPVAREAVFPVHLRDDDTHVNENGKRGATSKKSKKNRDAANELCSRRAISQPAREAKVAYHLYMMRESPENLGISVGNHDGAEHESKHEERERLQTIEIAQK